MASNTAAWLEKQGEELVVGEASMYEPGENQVLIKVAALAINPVDWKMAVYGLFIEKYPALLGCDVSGTIAKVGPNVTNFAEGDRVMAHATALGGAGAPQAAFQHYMIGQLPVVAKIPDSLSFEDATVLPLGINTAAAGLFQEETLGLTLPPSNAGKGKAVIIWGGSSSVGASAIQLASLAGYEVFTTASKRNHDFCTSLGAAQAFDYNDPSLVDDLVAALKGKEVVGALDAISEEGTVKTTCEILEKSGGRKQLATVLPGTDKLVPEGITTKAVFALTVLGNNVGAHLWNDYLPKALRDGTVKAKPDALVVGKGLESIQKGLDVNKKGVSGQKVVVSI